MSDVERQLRDALLRHAQAAPTGSRMLPRVRRTARRRRRRMLAGGLAATVALALAGVTGVAVFADRVGTSPAAGIGPEPVAVEFVAGTPVGVTFPVTPGGSLGGASPPVMTLVGGQPTLEYQGVGANGATTTVTAGGSAVTPVTGDPAAGDPTPTGDPSAPGDATAVPTPGADAATAGAPPGPSIDVHRIEVRGRPAMVGDRKGPDGRLERVLTMRYGADLWIEISAQDQAGPDAAASGGAVPGKARSGGVAAGGAGAGAGGALPNPAGSVGATADDSLPGQAVEDKTLVGYASTLIDRPMSRPAPFVFDLVPAGFMIDNIDSSAVTFCPPGTAVSAGFTDKIAVMLDADPSGATDAQRVTVAGRAGRLSTTDNVTVLSVDEGAGGWLTVQLPARMRVAPTDLLRFAAGIHLTAYATPGRG